MLLIAANEAKKVTIFCDRTIQSLGDLYARTNYPNVHIESINSLVNNLDSETDLPERKTNCQVGKQIVQIIQTVKSAR